MFSICSLALEDNDTASFETNHKRRNAHQGINIRTINFLATKKPTTADRHHFLVGFQKWQNNWLKKPPCQNIKDLYAYILGEFHTDGLKMLTVDVNIFGVWWRLHGEVWLWLHLEIWLAANCALMSACIVQEADMLGSHIPSDSTSVTWFRMVWHSTHGAAQLP